MMRKEGDTLGGLGSNKRTLSINITILRTGTQ